MSRCFFFFFLPFKVHRTELLHGFLESRLVLKWHKIPKRAGQKERNEGGGGGGDTYATESCANIDRNDE